MYPCTYTSIEHASYQSLALHTDFGAHSNLLQLERIIRSTTYRPPYVGYRFQVLSAAICRVQVTGAIFANFAAILVLCRPILEHVGAMLTHVGAENKQKQKVLIMQGYSGSISRTTSL